VQYVSVIVPAFNASQTIKETINSISAQTWPNLEIVVIDDGSTDETAGVVESLIDSDDRIRLVRQENRGLPRARNRGVAESRGNFIAPIDADDIWHPDKIRRQMERMQALGLENGIVYTLARTIDGESRVTGNKGFAGFEGRACLRSLIVNFVGNGSGILFRRTAFESVGGYDPTLKSSEDFHFQSKVARYWKIGAVPQYLTGYRISATAMSKNHKRMKEAHLDATLRLLADLPNAPPFALRAAESLSRARLAVARARTLAPADAARELFHAIRLSPRVALETLLLEELPRLSGGAVAAAGSRLSLRRALPLGRRFMEVDPASDEGFGTPMPPLAWLLRRCEVAEDSVAPLEHFATELTG
jgi:hypothetical protein